MISSLQSSRIPLGSEARAYQAQMRSVRTVVSGDVCGHVSLEERTSALGKRFRIRGGAQCSKTRNGGKNRMKAATSFGTLQSEG